MTESAPAGPGGIFISYRREDTAYSAGWLFDRLTARLGERRVFKDIDSIELGENFVEVIMAAVGSCDVLLALIGDQWLSATDAEGKRRLEDPDDFVRLEIETALLRDVRVIPILVDGAAMPRADQLPPSMAGLVRCQGLELSPSRFDYDTNRLLEVLEPTATADAASQGPEVVGAAAPLPPPAGSASWRRLHPSAPAGKLAIAGASLASLLLLVVVVRAGGPDGGDEQLVSEAGTTSSSVADTFPDGSLSGVPASSEAPGPPTTEVPGTSSSSPGTAGTTRRTGTVATAPPPGRGGSTSTGAPSRPNGAIFADDFSTGASGWQPSGRGAGSVVDGGYQLRIDPIAAGGGTPSYPRGASSVYPTAPASIRVEATAQRIAAGGQAQTMALVCRGTADSFYALVMGPTHVAIEKYTAQPPYYQELKDAPLAVDLNAPHRLRAVCRTDGAQQHLELSIDGRPVVAWTDGVNPLTGGTVGVGAFVGAGAHSIVARFDDFTVTAG